jgi:hypothetical protein
MPYEVQAANGGGTASVSAWGDAIVNSLTDLWIEFIGFLPSLIVAVIVFFVGWAIAVAVGRLIEKGLVVLRVNQAFDNLKGLQNAAARASLKVNIPRLFGEIIKWFLIVVTLLAATDILGLREVSGFLRQVLAYVPNVVVAALILIISVVLANFVYKTVNASVKAAGFGSGEAIAAVSKWAIIIFAFMAALIQLKVAETLINSLLTAVFAMLALAGGLSFGLGGKDMAAKWLAKMESDFLDKNK